MQTSRTGIERASFIFETFGERAFVEYFVHLRMVLVVSKESFPGAKEKTDHEDLCIDELGYFDVM